MAWDASAADCYADLRAQLERRGTPIGVLDTMIAAHALALGAILITNNQKHFNQVKALQCENWVR
jgi:tRNA(fMet)-specific endonuclease VapC